MYIKYLMFIIERLIHILFLIKQLIALIMNQLVNYTNSHWWLLYCEIKALL